jgi:hypothetical protein
MQETTHPAPIISSEQKLAAKNRRRSYHAVKTHTFFGGCSSDEWLSRQSKPGRKRSNPTLLLKLDAKRVHLLCRERLATQMLLSSFWAVSSYFDLFRPKNKSQNQKLHDIRIKNLTKGMLPITGILYLIRGTQETYSTICTSS